MHKIIDYKFTNEGWLYVEVDFGNDWLEDFHFPTLTQNSANINEIVIQAITLHATKNYSGDRRGPKPL